MGVEELNLGWVDTETLELEVVDVEVPDCWSPSGPLCSFATPFLFDALDLFPEDYTSVRLRSAKSILKNCSAKFLVRLSVQKLTKEQLPRCSYKCS